MMSKILLALAMCTSASAFVAPRAAGKTTVVLKDSLNGWVPDESKFAWGLPGTIAPVPDFDPAGFTNGVSLDDMKKYREAELQHGRVAMLAALGFLVGENYHPLFGLDGQEILAIDSLTEVRKVFPEFFELLTVCIATLELNRALQGWVNPKERGIGGAEGNLLNSDYYPGDVGFDPLGLKPEDPEEFATMATKELQNGRVAMLAAAGMVAQELVDHKPILLNDFGI